MYLKAPKRYQNFKTARSFTNDQQSSDAALSETQLPQDQELSSDGK